MARSQLYLYTIVVLLLILFYFVSNLDLLDKEFQFYSNTFPQYGEIYELLYGNDVFENILNLYGSTLIPFTVYYNCSYNIIQVPNYFNSTHVIVVDNVYNFLPSYASNNFVAFKIINNYSISSSNIGYCIFNGYEVYNPYFNNQFQGTGNLPYYVIFYPQNIFTINDNYLNNLYNLEGNVIFQYLNNYKCIAGEIKSLSVQKILNGISVSFLNISNAQLNNNIISVNIINNDICPINLNKIYYDNYNIQSFGNNFNTSSNSYLIYSGQQIIGYYQYNNDDLYFCLESLGNEICTPINNSPIQYYVPITLYNNQPIPTPEPFQQDIAICNGNPNLPSDFAYVNNATLFNEINPNGQNVMFFNPNNGQLFYSWYEGQLNYNGVTCNVWWVNIPNGIPANNNIVIYMAIGNYNTNYYSQYYPYVGEAPQLSPTYGEYDNGNYIFLFYDNFAGTTLNTGKWTSLASVYTINNGLQINATPSTMDNNFLESKSTYSVPLIIEIYRYTTVSNWFGFSFPNTYSSGGVLFYDQNEFYGPNGWSIYNGYQKISGGSESLNTWYIQTGILAPNGQALEYINYINVISSPNGYYAGTSGNIYVGDNGGRGIIQWLRIRAYPPNGVMPSISTGSENPWPP